MRKISTTILSVCAFACAFTAFATTKTELFSAQKLTASADAVTPAAASATQLLSPSSYAEYLALTDPTDVAATEKYTAIADGNVLYVYDVYDDVYRKYKHDTPSQNKITKLQFSDDNKLYFTDASTYLYVLDPEKLGSADAETAVSSKDFVCSTFLLDGDTMYFTKTSGGSAQILKTSLSDLNKTSGETLLENVSQSPALAFYNGELYYTEGGKYLNKIDPTVSANANLVAAFPSEILSMTIQDGVFVCATSAGEFLTYTLSNFESEKQANRLTPLYKATGGYSALSLFNDYVYSVKRNVIRQYSMKNMEFTQYEICGSSSAKNRLNGATDVFLADEKLFIADNGNRRISVYDDKTQTFEEPIATDLIPSQIASDGKTLLATNETSAILYSLSEENYGKTLASFSRFSGNVKGLAAVYGNYYLVTDENTFYRLTQNTDDSWELSSTQKNSTKYRHPTLLTADAYGNLYVVGDDNAVYRYSESEFLTTTATNTAICTDLPADTTKISVDYRGNLYALSGSQVYRYVAPRNAFSAPTVTYAASGSYTFNTPLVHDDEGAIRSFAFSIEENATYVLYKGNYLAKTDKLALPTVKTIAVNNADDSIFNASSATFTVVKTKPNALIVEFDIEQLQGASVFPYIDAKRSDAEKTALRLGATDIYDLLAIYDERTQTYATCLVHSADCISLDADEYRIDYPAQEIAVGYLSNDVSLYKFPYLTSLLTVCDMPRGGEVTLLGEINELDHAYYHISYTDTENVTHTGYIPKVYVAKTNGVVTPETLTLGETTSKTDAIGRMVYLLLGFGAICLLTDYLILRKPKEPTEEENEKTI